MLSSLLKSSSILKSILLYMGTAFLLIACFKEDQVPPSITLSGDTNFTVIIGNEYIEPGFTAIDKKDGDISYLVEVTGLPDTEVTGVYYIKYNVTDASGNHAKEMTRIVFVTHNSISLSGIYSASGMCKIAPVNNDNYFISTEQDDYDTKLFYLNGYNHLSKNDKIKAAIVNNTGQLLLVPEQIIKDTTYYGTGTVNNKGSEIILNIFKEFNGFKDSCNTILIRDVHF